MDRQIRKLGAALLVLFVVLLGQVTYIQVFASQRLADNPANARRQLIAEYGVDRGSILAADGRTVLASSRTSPGELKYQRRYPQGPLYAGVTGYYSIIFGRTELEQSFNSFLSASAPELLPQTLADQILGRPKQGATIVTTIDPVIQRAAARALGSLPGAVVALDPRTGDVKAIVANPTYDPNELSSQDPKVVRAAWEELNSDPDKPLLSRAIDELFPPGSTFKIVTAAAALENGFGPEPGAGDLGFDIPLEAGVFPYTSYFQDRLPAVAISAIGQDNVAANPMQMALVAAAIANGGMQMRPRLVTEIRDPTGQVIESFQPEVWGRPISAETAIQLTQMMVNVVRAGTGTAAQITGVDVAGKTGTAQHGEGLAPHAWFVSFAPVQNPEVVVAVIVLDGGSLGDEATGGQVAAPIAKAVMEAALDG